MTNVVNNVGVYVFHNVETDQTYVGSTNDLVKRRTTHLRQLKNGVHCNPKFQEAYANNSNFEYFEIPLENREEAFDFEQATIDELKGNPLLLNISTDVRDGGVSMHSEETKQKIREASLKHWSNPVYREKVVKIQTERMRSQTLEQKAIKNAKISFSNSKPKTDATLIRKALEVHHLANQKPVLIDDVRYASQKEAAKLIGVSNRVIVQRINSSSFLNYKRG